MFRHLALAVLLLTVYGSAFARDAIRVYGPGGPAPAMKAAAKAYGDLHQIDVEVTAAPTPECAGQVGMWEDIAGRDGDIRTVRALRRNIANFAVLDN